MAANEVVATPLDVHLIPCLLQPLLSLIAFLYSDDRLWLPQCLIKAGKTVKKAVASQMEEETLQNDKWWSHAQSMGQDSICTREIVRNLRCLGIIDGGASWTGIDLSKDVFVEDDGLRQSGCGADLPGLLRNVCFAHSQKTGYRILISGSPRCGQKHLASCLLHCFVGNIELKKIDLATISQEGHGDVEQGISRILMKCASSRLCAIFLPRIDLWAIEALSQIEGQDDVGLSDCDSLKELTSCQNIGEERCSPMRKSELVGQSVVQNYIFHVSRAWKSFREQLECICVSSSLIILATSELPFAALPCELRNFFGSETLPSESVSPRFHVEVIGEFDKDKLIHSSALDLSTNLIRQFVQVVHLRSHHNTDFSMASHVEVEDKRDVVTHETDFKSVEEPETSLEPSEDSRKTLSAPSSYPIAKEKSTLTLAVTSFGYQILRFPHFAELCWVTSKLNEGPSADIRGPWKGWPFNSCIVRPCQLTQKDVVGCNSSHIKGRENFTLVRGLIAVGLFAYRGIYKSSREVSLEVRTVLELLVGQIGVRIYAGKDRCQYIRLLSQVAYLEDMVNNWSHSLRSLEPDDPTLEMRTRNCQLNDVQTPENHQAPTCELIHVDEKPDIDKNDSQGTELAPVGVLGTSVNFSGAAESDMPASDVHFEEMGSAQDHGLEEPVVEGGCFQGSLAGKSSLAAVSKVNVGVDLTNPESSPEKTGAVNHLETFHAEEVAPEDSVNRVAMASVPASGADVDDSVLRQACSAISSEKIKKCGISMSKDVGGPTVIQLASSEYPDHRMSYACEGGSVEISGSTELCNLDSCGPTTENEVLAEAAKHKDLPGFKLSPDTCDVQSKSDAVCYYSCCAGCIGSLNQLLKKIITRKWEQSGSSCTVEDIHDLVSLLRTSVSSAVRNLYVTGEHESPIQREPSSAMLNKFETEDSRCCQCQSSESRTKFTDCICHLEEHASVELHPSFHDLLALRPKYFFRDGVLLSADPKNESSFHCQYETLCLCSLVELIASTQQP